jgi:Putative Actinobacterial Holin-X, holin superfamily III
MRVKERLGTSIGEVRDRGKRVAHLTLELAAAELKRKAAQFGAAFGLFVAAALFGFFLLAFLLAAVAAALTLVVPVWAALLITAGLLLALAGVLVVVGVGLVRSARTPVPRQAVEEARADVETFRRGLRDVVKRKARAAGRGAPPNHPAPPPTAQSASAPSGGTDGQE